MKYDHSRLRLSQDPMPAFICTACGTQYLPSEASPDKCPICTDERQFVPASGQSWTTLEGLRSAHSNKFHRLARGLTTIETTPAFGIGQRAILARTPADSVLWECIALIGGAPVDLLNGLGGVAAIAISHPHYYTTMVDWSRALGECRSTCTRPRSNLARTTLRYRWRLMADMSRNKIRTSERVVASVNVSHAAAADRARPSISPRFARSR